MDWKYDSADTTSDDIVGDDYSNLNFNEILCVENSNLQMT